MTSFAGTARLFNHHVNLGFVWLTLIDLIMFAAANVAATLIYSGYVTYPYNAIAQLPVSASLFAVTATLAMYSMGMYEPRLREGINGVLLRSVGALGLTTAALALIFYALPALHIWRGPFALTLVLAFLGTLLTRSVWTRLIDQEQFKRRVLVLGSGETAATINGRMRRRSDRRNFRIVSYVRQLGEPTRVENEPVISLDCPLSEFVQRNGIDIIVTALEDRENTLPHQELLACRAAGVRVMDIVDFFEEEAGKIIIAHVPSSWFTFASGFRAKGGRLSKRLFDVSMSFALLMAAWPFMLLTVLAIWIEDGIGAPVLYRQRRVGLNGRVFDVIKFRSMTVDAEGDGQARWAAANDARVTRVGHFIRKTRIDELPQIINVMAGDMAFVGPRPERPEFVRELRNSVPYYEKRHCVKPGITGWAQMNYPYGASLKDTHNKLEFDLYYVKHQGLFLDFLVLLQTAEVILFGKGAR